MSLSRPVSNLLRAGLICLGVLAAPVTHAASRRQSAEEWYRLTGTNASAPRVVLNKREIRFYFPTQNRPIGFVAELGRNRVRTDGYQVNSALLRLKKKLPPVSPGTDGWSEPVLVTAQEWRRVGRDVLAGLTPATPGHAKYYRGLFGDRLLYRDASGKAASAPVNQPPPGVVIDQRYSIEESLQLTAELAAPLLKRNHPGQSLFLLLVHQTRAPQPLLLDTARHRCIWFSSAALYEPNEPVVPLAPTFEGISALVFESNGLALIRNPVSSVGRLGNLLFETIKGLVRLPLPKPTGPVPPLAHHEGGDLAQDLAKWEEWLDHHTSTRREFGSLRLLIDGERFFPRLQHAISNATDKVQIHVFIFDNDDVAVEIADLLKQRSRQVRVNVILDRLASMSAARIPPATPPAKSYVPPSSISSYLQHDSKVRVRPFLNAFCSYDHSKVYLVDSTRAWMGGMNIGREYRSEWHDMMVEIQGPIVSSLERQYRLDWAHASWLGDLAYLQALLTVSKPVYLPPSTEPLIPLRLLPTTTTRKPFAKAVLQALRNAKSYIYVENPYLFDKRVMADLVRARARGVDVRVIMPHVNDSRAGGRAELMAANYLVQNGVRVFFYPGMTHVKAVLADGWACVGSGNLNEFSFGICEEHNVATSDPAFSSRLKHDLFEEDFKHCFELTDPVAVQWMDFVAGLVLEGI